MDKQELIVGEIDSAELCSEDVRWWELAGHDAGALGLAWDELRRAVVVATSLHDKHTELTWIDGAGLLDGLLISEPIGGERPLRTALRVWDLRLFVVDDAGEPIGSVELAGLQPAKAMARLREIAGHSAETQDTAESETAFGEPSQLAQAELIRLYANTSTMLERLAVLAESGAPVRICAEGLDLSMGLPAAARLGIYPPGALADTACWASVPAEGEPSVLPADEVTSTEDPAEQRRRVAAFLAEAWVRANG